MAAHRTCGSCGTELRVDANFCDQCGLPTTPSYRPANYKQVTVLFADVVRSMDIAAAVDLERLREIMTQLVERSAAVVRRYGGTVEHTGDGVMALFGAPVALEDHAHRACLAALGIQQEIGRLADEVAARHRLSLQVRIGLNSGLVIAGQIGAGSLGYAATGQTVGFAQRMEAAAAPGAVMLSESTARLVEQSATLGPPEWVHIKGADVPVRGHRLDAMPPRHGLVGDTELRLVGRSLEMTTLHNAVDRTVSGGGGAVVNVVGPPGIGKSRLAREVAALAAGRGVEVFWTFCESHARDVPFHAVAGLLRVGLGIADLDSRAARARVREQVQAGRQDLLVLDDLLGIAEPGTPLPQIDPDARRRRLTAVINAASLARSRPALFIVEDAHWMDAVSESMLTDFFTVLPGTASMALVTSRPDHPGILARLPGTQSVTLAPLSNSDIGGLIGELVGSDPSVGELSAVIVGQADGNPFFAQELVRELAQRGVLTGERGHYLCRQDVADVRVPPTVQAAIEARIDRLDVCSRQVLSAASVIGARFSADLVAALGVDVAVDELLRAELIDQVRVLPGPEYTFRHPLIRAVAYESQLKTDRAQWHRTLASVIEAREPAKAEENAALIAGHLESAGDLHAAYSWHMRAAAASSNWDLSAARVSWERARRIADGLSAEEPTHLAMCIAPRTMLCVTSWLPLQDSPENFAELRELCGAAGDRVSLAMSMTGPVAALLYTGRSREGARLASEQLTLLASIDDPGPLMGLAFAAFANWCDSGDAEEMLDWSRTIIDLAGGDSSKGGDFGLDSPLAVALAWHGFARWWLGLPDWRRHLAEALEISRGSSPTTFASIVAWTYGPAIQYGVLRSDDKAVEAAEKAAQAAAGSSNDVALHLAEYTLGVTLINREDPSARRRGVELLRQVREWLLECAPFLVPVVELWCSREQFGSSPEESIQAMRRAVDELYRDQRLGYGIWGSEILVQTLLERAGVGDLPEAEAAIERLALLRPDRHSAARDITLLHLRALLARSQGRLELFQDLTRRYRVMAESLGFEGHRDRAEAIG